MRRRRLAVRKARWDAIDSILGGDVRKGPHGRSPLVFASVRRDSLVERTARRSPMYIRAAVHRPDVLLFPNSIRPMRHQTRSSRAILRKHRRGAVRQRLAGSLGRGEEVTLRVVQRLRENCFETTHGHCRP